MQASAGTYGVNQTDLVVRFQEFIQTGRDWIATIASGATEVRAAPVVLDDHLYRSFNHGDSNIDRRGVPVF